MSGDFVSRLLFDGRMAQDEVQSFLHLGRPLGRRKRLRYPVEGPESAVADVGREIFRAMLVLEGKAFVKAFRSLREREAERYLGFGHLAQDVHEDELERQQLAAQVNFQVLKRLVPDRHVIPPDLDGLTAEDWYVAYYVARWSEQRAADGLPLHPQS